MATRRQNGVRRDLVLRFADNLFHVGNVIERHEEVISRYGAVWFGKLGQPIGRSTAARLVPTAGGIVSNLFLVQRRDRRSHVFQSEILDIAHEFPAGELHLLPPYYDEFGLMEHMTSWVKIGVIEEQPSEILGKLVVVSSGRALTDALRTSLAGSFIVQSFT